jgi:Cu(I)/Ag(I) efflux system membrane fusion protein
MNSTLAILIAGVFVVGACRNKPKPTVGEMTAEEHARVQAGAPATSDSAAGQRTPVHLSAEQARAIGVAFTIVGRGPLVRTVRTVGQVVPAESNLSEITAKIDGFVEQLFVNATGTSVRRGQPLLTLYSPMLVAAQEELLTASRMAAGIDTSNAETWRNGQVLLDAARRRLAYWDISPEQIDRLERSGEVTKTLTLNAPLDGIVMEKMVVAGQSVVAGMTLYRIADLRTVWIEGAVFEQDVALVRVGAPVRAELAAYPGQSFTGRVSFVWPTVDEQSRTVRVRVAFPNSGGRLKPGMYATLFFEALIGRDVLQVPTEAVVQTGERNLVFVVGAGGALEPREIVLGPRAGGLFQVLSGLAGGERIVASANFLVDAESRLGTGAQAMPGMDMNTENKRP